MLKQSWQVLALLSMYSSLSYAPVEEDDFSGLRTTGDTNVYDDQDGRKLTVTVSDYDQEQLANELDHTGQTTGVTLGERTISKLNEPLPTEIQQQKAHPIVNQDAVNKLLQSRSSFNTSLQDASDDTEYVKAVESTLSTMDEDWATSKTADVQNAFDIVNKRKPAPNELYNEPIKKYQKALQDLHRALRNSPVDPQLCFDYLEQMKQQIEKVAELNLYEKTVHPVRKALNSVAQGVKTAWKRFMTFMRKSAAFRFLESYLKKTSAEQIMDQTAVDKQLVQVQRAAKDNPVVQEGLTIEKKQLLGLAAEIRASLLKPQQDAVESLSDITEVAVAKCKQTVTNQMKDNVIMSKLQTFLDSTEDKTMPAFLKSDFVSDMQQHIEGLQKALLINKQQETVQFLREKIVEAQFFLAEVTRQYEAGLLKKADQATLVGNYQDMVADFLTEALVDIKSTVKDKQLASLRESQA